MSDHQITIFTARTPDGPRYAAICSCKRWRSKYSAEENHARSAGDVHQYKGDQQNRAAAQFDRGRAQTVRTLSSELKWYEEQANNPLNSEKDRELWQALADELRPRVQGPPDEDQLGLFSI